MFFGGEHTDGIFDLARARSEALESTLVIWMPSSYTISSPNIWSEAEERPVKIDKIGIGPGYMENTLGMSLLPVEVCFTVRLMTPPQNAGPPAPRSGFFRSSGKRLVFPS